MYRPWFKRFNLCLFLLLGLSGPGMGIELVLDPPDSIYQRAEQFLIATGCLLFAGIFFIQYRKFREIVVDSTGLRFEPLGLYIAADQIEEISWAEKYTGNGGHLKIKLKEPRLLFYIGAWSFGSTATVGFNPQVLRTEQST